VQRREEARHRSLVSLLAEYGSVFEQVLHSNPLLAALSLMIIFNIYTTIGNSFWGVLFTRKLGFDEGLIAGQLSAIARALPFALNLGLFTLGLLVVWILSAAQASFPPRRSPNLPRRNKKTDDPFQAGRGRFSVIEPLSMALVHEYFWFFRSQRERVKNDPQSTPIGQNLLFQIGEISEICGCVPSETGEPYFSSYSE
jgi:hypothetical protein